MRNTFACLLALSLGALAAGPYTDYAKDEAWMAPRRN